MYEVRAGDPIVVGYEGVRVEPQRKAPLERGLFEFMSSTASPEKSKQRIIRDVAAEMRETKRSGTGKILWVLGPAVVHTGARGMLRRILDAGYVDVVFAGNGLAAHDIEVSLYGPPSASPSRGGSPSRAATNTISGRSRRPGGGGDRARRRGGAGQGRDHAPSRAEEDPLRAVGFGAGRRPLPEVITDSVKAQARMRELTRGVTMAVMVATMLHSIAAETCCPPRSHGLRGQSPPRW
jgi:hypothetical protein